MRRLLQAPDKLLTITYTTNIKFSPLITLDGRKMHTHARPAIRDLLLQLHIYRCTADPQGVTLYDQLSQVDDEMLAFRKCILSLRLPRDQFVQPNTVIEGEGGVEGL